MLTILIIISFHTSFKFNLILIKQFNKKKDAIDLNDSFKTNIYM